MRQVDKNLFCRSPDPGHAVLVECPRPTHEVTRAVDRCEFSAVGCVTQGAPSSDEYSSRSHESDRGYCRAYSRSVGGQGDRIERPNVRSQLTENCPGSSIPEFCLASAPLWMIVDMMPVSSMATASPHPPPRSVRAIGDPVLGQHAGRKCACPPSCAWIETHPAISPRALTALATLLRPRADPMSRRPAQSIHMPSTPYRSSRSVQLSRRRR